MPKHFYEKVKINEGPFSGQIGNIVFSKLNDLTGFRYYVIELVEPSADGSAIVVHDIKRISV